MYTADLDAPTPSDISKELGGYQDSVDSDSPTLHELSDEIKGVKAKEQKIKLERLTADQAAKAYEQHMAKLNSAVFPTSKDPDMGRSTATGTKLSVTSSAYISSEETNVMNVNYQVREPCHSEWSHVGLL